MKNLLYILLSIPLFGFAQTPLGLTDPKGGEISNRPSITVTNNNTETTLFTDSIPANRLIPFVHYRVKVKALVTTGLANLSVISFKVYYGGSSATVLTSSGILSSITGGMIEFDAELLANTMSQQILYTNVVNYTPGLLTLTPSNMSNRVILAGDASQRLQFRITCTINGLTAASLTTEWVNRPSY